MCAVRGAHFVQIGTCKAIHLQHNIIFTNACALTLRVVICLTQPNNHTMEMIFKPECIALQKDSLT